jgi:hypothetical protein
MRFVKLLQSDRIVLDIVSIPRPMSLISSLPGMSMGRLRSLLSLPNRQVHFRLELVTFMIHQGVNMSIAGLYYLCICSKLHQIQSFATHGELRWGQIEPQGVPSPPTKS